MIASPSATATKYPAPSWRQTVSGTAHSMRDAFTSHSERLAEESVHIPMAPMIPAILAGGAILYNQGVQNNHPGQGGDTNAWKRIMLEAAAGHWLAQSTSGAYPLLGVALAAYRGGTAPTKPEAVHEIVNTLTTLGLGWMGVLGFSFLGEARHTLDEQKALYHLQNQPDLLNRLKANAHPLNQDLGKTLETLQTTIQTKHAEPARHWKNRQRLHAEANQLRTAVMRTVEALGEQLHTPKDSQAQSHFKKLIIQIGRQENSFNKFLHFINPMCGYILFGLMLGPGVSHWLNRRLDSILQPRMNNYQSKGIAPHVAMFPIEHSILQANLLGGGHNSAKSAGMASPYVVWPGSSFPVPH